MRENCNPAVKALRSCSDSPGHWGWKDVVGLVLIFWNQRGCKWSLGCDYSPPAFTDMDTLNCTIYQFFHSAGSSRSAATGEAVAGLGFVRVERWKFWG